MTATLLDPSPTIIDDVTRREFVVGALAIGALVASGCSDDEERSGAQAPTREFVDDAGRIVQIPQHPERVVALASFSLGESVLSLNGPLIGMVEDGGEWFPAIDEQYDLAGVTPVGEFAAVDAEALRRLSPDLIIAHGNDGTYSHDVDIDLLAQIAPVVVINENQPQADLQDKIAALIDRRNELTALREDYQQRVEELAARVPEGLSAVVMAKYGPDPFIFTEANPNPLSAALLDLAVTLPPAARDTDEIYFGFSAERLADPEIQADVLLLPDGFDPWVVDDDPLAQRIPAVAAGQSYTAPGGFGVSYRVSLFYLDYLEPILVSADPDVIQES